MSSASRDEANAARGRRQLDRPAAARAQRVRTATRRAAASAVRPRAGRASESLLVPIDRDAPRHEDHEFESVGERHGAELARGKLGLEEVARLDRAPEPAVCAPLARHRQKGPVTVESTRNTSTYGVVRLPLGSGLTPVDTGRDRNDPLDRSAAFGFGSPEPPSRSMGEPSWS